MNSPESASRDFRTGKLPDWLFGIICISAFVLWILLCNFFNQREWRAKVRIPRAQSDSSGLVTALDAFAREYGYHPDGSPAEILRTLRGGNTRNIVFFECRDNSVNSIGEFIDPWGQPYLIDQTDPSVPRVYSSGPNRIDEHGAKGSDDIVGKREPRPQK